MKAIRIERHGGPEVLELQELPQPTPSEGQVVIRLEAVGVNFLDIKQREGRYPASLPYTPGVEGAGEVVAIGSGVHGLKIGERVAYTGVQGSYAEFSVVPTDRLIPVPEILDSRTVAALMLQGMTAHYLTNDTYPLKPGDTCLIHAAAGGVGALLIQLAKMRGATVIGTTSTPIKAERAKAVGADHVILYSQEDFEVRVKELTDGRGVQVIYDAVGKATFERGLDCLTPRGMMVLYGASSGLVPPLDPQVLNRKGSLFLTRPSLRHYIATRKELVRRAGEVLALATRGKLVVTIDSSWPLTQAAEAHRKLQDRQTSGKLLLIP